LCHSSLPLLRVSTLKNLVQKWKLQTTALQVCKGNSQIPIFWLCNSCDTLQFLWLCAIIHLKSCIKSQHPLITQSMLHIVYPYHIVPLSISVPCYYYPTPSPSCFTYSTDSCIHIGMCRSILRSNPHKLLLCSTGMAHPSRSTMDNDENWGHGSPQWSYSTCPSEIKVRKASTIYEGDHKDNPQCPGSLITIGCSSVCLPHDNFLVSRKARGIHSANSKILWPKVSCQMKQHQADSGQTWLPHYGLFSSMNKISTRRWGRILGHTRQSMGSSSSTGQSHSHQQPRKPISPFFLATPIREDATTDKNSLRRQVRHGCETARW